MWIHIAHKNTPYCSTCSLFIYYGAPREYTRFNHCLRAGNPTWFNCCAHLRNRSKCHDKVRVNALSIIWWILAYDLQRCLSSAFPHTPALKVRDHFVIILQNQQKLEGHVSWRSPKLPCFRVSQVSCVLCLPNIQPQSD